MSNVSKEKREEMLNFLDGLKEESKEEERIRIIHEIEDFINEKKYGLVWEKHSEYVKDMLKTHIPVFKEVEEKKIIKKDALGSHFLIEGDNLHSLLLLRKTHSLGVDTIYIDPPYNTESHEFRYDDDYIEKTDGFSHSKWISFMKERLVIAHELLKNTGCIMLSINENELFVLKLLMDEIFGEENYLTAITVKVRHEDRILKGDKDIHEVTEFLLFYRKSKDFIIKKRVKDNTDISEYKYRIEELTDTPKIVRMDNKLVEVFLPGQYEVLSQSPFEQGLKKINIRGSLKEGNSSGRFYMKHLDALSQTEDGSLYKVYDMGADDLGYRYFRIPLKSEKRVNGDYFQGIPKNKEDLKYIPYPNYVDFTDEFNTVGYEGGVEFRNGKKPVQFLKYCMELAGVYENRNSVILDFFGGSASTFEAVQQINKLDGGSRSVIICTNNDVGYKNYEKFKKLHGYTDETFNIHTVEVSDAWKAYVQENGICSSVTYPRMRNVIEGYSIMIRKKEIRIEGISGNLNYLKTDFVPKTEETDVKDLIRPYMESLLELRW